LIISNSSAAGATGAGAVRPMPVGQLHNDLSLLLGRPIFLGAPGCSPAMPVFTYARDLDHPLSAEVEQAMRAAVFPQSP